MGCNNLFMETHFLIISTGYNCASYVKKCYESILKQNYSNFDCVLLSDGSTDNTRTALINLANKDPRFEIFICPDNRGAAYRRWQTINSITKKKLSPDTVIVLLGLDDEITPDALDKVSKQYTSGKWMTYGNWIDADGNKLPDGFLDFPEYVHANRDYRKHTYRSTALNTFKKFLFDRMTVDDFIVNDHWIRSTTESNLMISCLEMCGKERIGIVYSHIYLYNKGRRDSARKRFGNNYQNIIFQDMVSRPKKELVIDEYSIQEWPRLKILNVCSDDYANFSYENCKALKSIGMNCCSVKTMAHVFNYNEESEILNTNKINDLINQYDIIQFFHSDTTFLNIAVKFKKKIIVYHTGSNYRSRPSHFNSYFNPHVIMSFTDQCEFMSLGAKNVQYIATAIDVKSIDKFGHEIKKPFKVAHFPSNAEVKGTSKILEMLSKVKNEFILDVSTKIVSHPEQWKRMNDCDIYIELFKPELNGKPYGCYGVTAFEAAAAGKVVITQNINPHVYADAYGECPFIICNTEKEFIDNMERIVSLSPDELSELQTKTYNWVKNNHGYRATGEYILKHLPA